MSKIVKTISISQIIGCIETANAYKNLLQDIDTLINKYNYTLFVQDIKRLEELKRVEREAYMAYMAKPIFQIKENNG